MYTVKQLSSLAGVTIRTLHYYDEKGLLKPAIVGDNSYRYYDEGSLFQLQQIMLYREMDFSLGQIKSLLDDPEFDILAALAAHRENLRRKIERLERLVLTVDQTMRHLEEGQTIDMNEIFSGFSDEEQAAMQGEAAELYGQDEVTASVQRWQSYSKHEQAAIVAEGNEIYATLAALVDQDVAGDEVQGVIGRWHQHTRYFYEPTAERLRGLGQMYSMDPAFSKRFAKLHPELPAFLTAAIGVYVAGLESG